MRREEHRVPTHSLHMPTHTHTLNITQLIQPPSHCQHKHTRTQTHICAHCHNSLNPLTHTQLFGKLQLQVKVNALKNKH